MPELIRPEPARSWRDRVEIAIEAVRNAPHGVVAGVTGAVVGGAVAVVVAGTLLKPPPPPPELSLPRADAVATQATAPAEVVVHVTGAVLRPGVHRLGDRARVADALEAAGGPAPDADLERVNLARLLVDGERLYVVRKGEAEPPAESGPAAVNGPPATGPVDLNRASAKELEALPGVGPATAEAIVEYRDRVGRFRSVEELLEVRGIGAAKLEQLRPHVRV